MKKISMLSLIAVLAATPMMAEAAQVAKINADAPTAQEIAAKKIATTSYVQGAYKDAADKIDAVIEDAHVASNGTYIDKDESVAHNLGELDTAVANLAQSTTNVIGGLDANLSTEESNADGIDMRLVETDGKVTSISANIKDAAVVDSKIATSAVTTDKINAGAVTFAKMNADAVVTATEGISSDINTASDSALVTEKAVKAAIDTINSAAGDLASDLADEVSARKLADSGLAADIVAAESAAKAYVDATTVTVYTTWGSDTSATVGLNTAQNLAAAAAAAASPVEPSEQPGGGE